MIKPISGIDSITINNYVPSKVINKANKQVKEEKKFEDILKDCLKDIK